MAILSSAIFWGSVLILIGISIILKVVFGFHLPIFRIAFALFFIFLGVKLLFGISFKQKNERDLILGKSKFYYDQQNPEQNLIFSKGEIFYTNVDLKDEHAKGKINVVFSHGQLFIDESIPMKIKVSTVFGGTMFPDETVMGFGEYTYKTNAYKEGEAHLHVKVDVVFSGFEIKRIKNKDL